VNNSNDNLKPPNHQHTAKQQTKPKIYVPSPTPTKTTAIATDTKPKT